MENQEYGDYAARKTRCSRPREHLVFLKILVPEVGKAHFFRFQLFPKSGTAIFIKFRCSRLWEHLFL